MEQMRQGQSLVEGETALWAGGWRGRVNRESRGSRSTAGLARNAGKTSRRFFSCEIWKSSSSQVCGANRCRGNQCWWPPGPWSLEAMVGIISWGRQAIAGYWMRRVRDAPVYFDPMWPLIGSWHERRGQHQQLLEQQPRKSRGRCAAGVQGPERE